MPLLAEVFAQAAQGQPLCLFLACGISLSFASLAFAAVRSAVRAVLR